MSNRTIELSDALYDYYLKLGIREPEILKELRAETAALSSHVMQIAPEQGQFMAMLVKLTGAKHIVEVGTYTGYSALAMALALPDDGQLITCDIDEHSTKIARHYWEKAGVAHKITLKLAPALQTLAAFNNMIDLAFIDADKRNYLAYYEYLLAQLRPGGLILVDNVLWGGKLIDPQANEKNTQALREFNQALHQDSRIELCMVPIGDGLTMARKL